MEIGVVGVVVVEISGWGGDGDGWVWLERLGFSGFQWGWAVAMEKETVTTTNHHQGCQLPHTRGLWSKRPDQSYIHISTDICLEREVYNNNYYCLAMAEGENLMEPINGKWLELYHSWLNHHYVSNKLPRK